MLISQFKPNSKNSTYLSFYPLLIRCFPSSLHLMHPPRVHEHNPFLRHPIFPSHAQIHDPKICPAKTEEEKRKLDASNRSIRVVMFPWLAHGHISPFLQLAKSLVAHNFIAYICSSQTNLDQIRRRLSTKDAISIKLVELPITATPELPPPLHTTKGIPPRLMPALKRALDSARPTFSTLLATLKSDLL